MCVRPSARPDVLARDARSGRSGRAARRLRGQGPADIPLAAGENGALPSLPPIPYAVAVTGELPPELGSLLRQLATTSADGAPPATSRLAISQRGEADRAKLEQALRAQGYFDGTVAAAVREPGEVASQGIADQLERLASPPQAVLVFDVTPGPRYQFGTLAIELTDNPAQWQAPPPKDLGLVVGGPR